MALADSKDMAQRTLRIDCHVCHVLELPGFVWLHNSPLQRLVGQVIQRAGPIHGQADGSVIARGPAVKVSRSLGSLSLLSKDSLVYCTCIVASLQTRKYPSPFSCSPAFIFAQLRY